MKKALKKLKTCALFVCLISIAVFCTENTTTAQGRQITLTGEINDTYQLVADGKVYDIAETPAGNDLVKNYISQKVKVTGMLTTGPEIDVITVRLFEVVDE